MPDHKTHVIFGTVLSIVVYFIIYKTQIVPTTLQGFDWAMIALIVYLYSQLPDIDADTSIINKIWNVSAGLGGLYCLYTGRFRILWMFAILSIITLEFIRHRGFTHEEWFGIIMAAPLWVINPIFAIVAITAFISTLSQMENFWIRGCSK
jgi:membrane-bound metal-dependent hydrolase YbcI (DUF457 family)